MTWWNRGLRSQEIANPRPLDDGGVYTGYSTGGDSANKSSTVASSNKYKDTGGVYTGMPTSARSDKLSSLNDTKDGVRQIRITCNTYSSVIIVVLFALVAGLYGQLALFDQKMDKVSEELQLIQSMLQVYSECPSSQASLPPRVSVTLRSGLRVLCDTGTSGGRWLVFQRRLSEYGSFDKNYTEYVSGFGKLDGSFWLGLENLHSLCKNPMSCELRVDMEFAKKPDNTTYVPQTKSYQATYDQFSVGNSSSGYTLIVAGYRTGSTADDAFSRHNGAPFSTKDNNLTDLTGCKRDLDNSGGFWYTPDCGPVNLNGLYNHTKRNGLMWGNITGEVLDKDDSALTFVEMKLRVL